MMRYLLLAVVAIISLHQSIVNAQCPTSGCHPQLSEQELICKAGEGISNIAWVQSPLGCRRYEISCMPATNSCSEVCSWNTQCSQTGENYVQGIRAVYDPSTHRQDLQFFCCGTITATTVQPTTEQMCATPTPQPPATAPGCSQTYTTISGAKTAGSSYIYQIHVASDGSLEATYCDNDATLCPTITQHECCCGDPNVFTCQPGCVVCSQCLPSGGPFPYCADLIGGPGGSTTRCYFYGGNIDNDNVAGYYCDYRG